MSRAGTVVLAVVAVLACAACAMPDSLGEPVVGLVEGSNSTSMSREWLGAMLTYGEPGICHPRSPTYHWRDVGWGSNMNQILKRWVNGISEGHQDCALDVTQSFLQQIRCPSASDGSQAKGVRGWRCMFRPMQRLCTFQTVSALQKHRAARENYASNVNLKLSLPRPADMATMASAVLDFIYSHTQPWFERDIEKILGEESVSSLRADKFVAIHVRRGDKLQFEAKKVEVEVYLQAAARYLYESSADRYGAESISGVWVSSDDSIVLPEVKELASSYFPNVQTEKIITISFRDNGPDHPHETADELSTRSNEMTYELYVGLHAELIMLSEAEVFVGTFTSNIARFVYVMRESNGLPRNSAISVDRREREWRLH
ncbi:unnamed protein product [Scytosiphon promiscuus]